MNNIMGRKIGIDCNPYVIAELSGNHGGDFMAVMSLIEAASDAGCDAVKIQIYDPQRLAKARGGEDKVLTHGPWKGRTLLDIYTEGAFHFDWIPMAQDYCYKHGMAFFASVFDEQGVTIAKMFEFPVIKVSSFDVTNLKLLDTAARAGVPVILSTGMASMAEVDIAVGMIKRANPNLALLHCISEYPAPIHHMNIGKIDELMYRYQVPVGLSDHCPDPTPGIAAVARGACILEKHLRLEGDTETLDAMFSLDPHQMKDYVRRVTEAWMACLTPEDGENINTEYCDLRVKSEAH